MTAHNQPYINIAQSIVQIVILISGTSVRMSQRSPLTLNDVEPAANLRHLLYGPQLTSKNESPPSPIGDNQNLLNYTNFLTIFDRSFDFDSNDTCGNALVKKQDEYIEQLENENKMIKKQLEAVHSKVQEVVSENQGLIRERKSDVLNVMVADPSNTLNSKGLSDEEKMFQGKRDGITSNNQRELDEYVHKIKQLENEISRLREEHKKDSKEELLINLTTLQRDNHNLSVRIGQLEDVISRLKEREDEAQSKIRQGIILVEQAQMEKYEAVMDRDAFRDSLDKQQKRFEEMVKDYESRIEAEKERVTKLHENRVTDTERELQQANVTVAALKTNLEKSEREKLDLRHQLQRVSSQLDNFQTEYQTSMEHFQEDVTRALLDRNHALESAAQMKMTSERMKMEHQKELQWMKLELEDYRKRFEEVSRSHLKTKSELSRLQQQRKLLETHVDHAKSEAERQKNATKEDADEMRKYSRLREEQMRAFTETTKRQYVARHSELENMLEKQIELGKRFRAECHLLDDRLHKLAEIHKNSTVELQRENERLAERVMTSDGRCVELQALIDQLKMDQMQIKNRSIEMEKEISSKNDRITDLLNQLKLLVKERQMLQEELKFVLENLNDKTIGKT